MDRHAQVPRTARQPHITRAVPPTISIQNSNQCTQLQNGNFNQAGWQINLDAASADGTFLAERMITDPTISPGNKVYLTTSEPTSNPCGYGGQSRVWGLNCATGALLSHRSIMHWIFGDRPDRHPVSANLHRGDIPDHRPHFISVQQQQSNPVVSRHSSGKCSPAGAVVIGAAKNGAVNAVD